MKSYSSLLFSVVSVTFSRTSAKLTACFSFFARFFLSLLNCIFLNLFCLVFPSMSISGSVLVFSFVFLLLSNFDLMFSVLGKRLDSSSSTCISCSAAAVTGPVLAICQRMDIINFNNHTTWPVPNYFMVWHSCVFFVVETPIAEPLSMITITSW